MTRAASAAELEARAERLSPRAAVRLIAAWTLGVTTLSGVAMRIADPHEFPTVGKGLWWAAQTVTTVGYGDVVPHATAGRVLALVVMVSAIALVTVVTGAITAALIDGVRERRAVPPVYEARAQLDEICVRLARLEHELRRQSTQLPR